MDVFKQVQQALSEGKDEELIRLVLAEDSEFSKTVRDKAQWEVSTVISGIKCHISDVG